MPLGFFRLPFAQAHPRPTAIFIDELNARGLERAAKGQIISSGQRSLGVSHLRTEDGVSPLGRFSCEIVCSPPQQGPRSPDLRTGQRLDHLFFAEFLDQARPHMVLIVPYGIVEPAGANGSKS